MRRLTMVVLLLVMVLVIGLCARNDAKTFPAPSHPLVALPKGGQTQTARAPLRLPPPWEPLQISEPALMKLASMGDRPAAERLFAEARRCLKARRLEPFFKGKNYEAWAADAENRQYLDAMDKARRDRSIRAVKANIELANASDRLCGNTDATLSDGQIYRIAFVAARLGDDDATACILSGAYDPPKMTPLQAAAFDSEAMELGRRALARGHWNTVLALEAVYSYSGVEGQTGPVSHINPADFLKMLNLQWRGTPRDTPESSALARQIEFVQTRVTPAEKFAAERWADETYARAFYASGPATSTDAAGCDR